MCFPACYHLFVSNSAIDCLERLVSKMTYYVSSGTLHPTVHTHSSPCTLCLKKVPTFILSVTLSNFNHFHIFCIAGKRIKFATKPIRHYPPHLTLGMLLHYLGKLKIQISGRLSTVPESCNILNSSSTPCFVQHFSRNSSVNLFAVYPFKYKPFKNLLLVAEHHADC